MHRVRILCWGMSLRFMGTQAEVMLMHSRLVLVVV